MSDIPLFFKGLVLGFSIAAPVGPIGLLCIRRTLAGGQRLGLATGLGAATADGLYGLVAALGLTLVADFLVAQESGLRLFGWLYLVYLGVHIFFSPPAEKSAVTGSRGLLGAYLSTFVLTLSNPATILSFAPMFIGLGLAAGASRSAAVALVLGVFLGSAAWWLSLTTLMALFGARLGPGGLRWVNRISGALIVALAVGVML